MLPDESWLVVRVVTEFGFAWSEVSMADVRDIGAAMPGCEENNEAEGWSVGKEDDLEPRQTCL